MVHLSELCLDTLAGFYPSHLVLMPSILQAVVRIIVSRFGRFQVDNAFIPLTNTLVRYCKIKFSPSFLLFHLCDFHMMIDQLLSLYLSIFISNIVQCMIILLPWWSQNDLIKFETIFLRCSGVQPMDSFFIPETSVSWRTLYKTDSNFRCVSLAKSSYLWSPKGLTFRESQKEISQFAWLLELQISDFWRG